MYNFYFFTILLLQTLGTVWFQLSYFLFLGRRLLTFKLKHNFDCASTNILHRIRHFS